MMNLIYALHHKGCVTCPVIWGNIPENDDFLRNLASIPPHERITGLVFCGYQENATIQVARSKRIPIESVLSIC